MTTTDHGLIIGKFLPPHAGHELLIRTAAATSRRVSVLVLAHPDERIPLADRVAWLLAMFADVANVSVAGGIDPHPIDYDSADVWDLHEAEFRSVLSSVTTEPVTAVFSSEPYGHELARRFGAVAIQVDVRRGLVPVSGTAVRNDPVSNWNHLSPPVRAGLAQRIVVLGAESTGTTTVSGLITDALRARGRAHGQTRWVPEVGRTWTIDKLAIARAEAQLLGTAPPALDELAWPSEEFVAIAQAQNELEDQEAALGGPVLICDTDAFATGVWHERYVGHRNKSVNDLGRFHPLYLLTHHDDVPFIQDGIRDGEAIRSWMTERFIEALEETGRRFAVLRGPLERRVADALSAIDELPADSWAQ